MKKNKRKRKGYVACYTYRSSFGVQFIYIKFEDDSKAIDSLLESKFEKQAVLISDQSYNLILNA